MSRSFKKTLGWKDRNPYMKNYANRVVRRMSTDEEAPQYKTYRRINNPWDICDYKFLYYNKRQVQEYYNKHDAEAVYWESLGFNWYAKKLAARYRKAYKYKLYMK